jgi:hypothetical protein
MFLLLFEGLYLMQFCLDFRIFFLLNGYLSQNCTAKKIQKTLTIFPWRTEWWMGVQRPHECWENFSSSFEPPYLEEK